MILVHDAARPLLPDDVVERLVAALGEGYDGAVPTYLAPDPASRQAMDSLRWLIQQMYEIAGISQASAESGPTMQEKMACRADAETFCSQFIGKAPQMRACLEQNKAKLSSPCRAVVEAHGG